ncbi:MAG: GTPase Era [Burkholderiaceae bacterium]|jgi:GTP-binding protein Era|nr:GTPase Era [Burkholderiaceae bacterium]
MTFRCGTVALVGRPNVGKSTLLNALVGQKVSITSRKAQTTRHRILGVQTTETAQFILVDTPGFQTKYSNAMNKAMNRTVRSTMADVDVICFVVESGYWSPADQQVLELLPKDIPVVLLANKLDVFAASAQSPEDRDLKLFTFMREMDEKFSFKEIIPLSAKNADDIQRLLTCLETYLPEQEAIYDPDMLTDRSEKFLAAEILREKVFRHTGDELPYASAVVIDQFKLDGRLRRIAATILVDRESHKAMVIGEKGAKLKRISTEARQDMEKLFDGKVFLETWVKVKSGWADDRTILREQGLE